MNESVTIALALHFRINFYEATYFTLQFNSEIEL